MKTLGSLLIIIAIASLIGCGEENSSPTPQANNVSTNSTTSNRSFVVPPPPTPASSTSVGANNAPASSNSAVPIASGTDSTAQARVDANLPKWEPDKAMLDQLEEYADFEGYQIRIPKGFKPDAGTPYPNTVGKAWGMKNNNKIQLLELYILTPPEMPPQLSSDQIASAASRLLESFLNGCKPHYENWREQPPEQGKINGMLFSRVQCEAKNKELQVDMSQVYYMAFDENKFILALSYGNANSTELSDLARASILTFRKK